MIDTIASLTINYLSSIYLRSHTCNNGAFAFATDIGLSVSYNGSGISAMKITTTDGKILVATENKTSNFIEIFLQVDKPNKYNNIPRMLYYIYDTNTKENIGHINKYVDNILVSSTRYDSGTQSYYKEYSKQ